MKTPTKLEQTFLSPEFWKHATLADVQTALQQGLDMTARSSYEETPLMLAAKYNCDLDILDLLVQVGADVNARTSHGHAILMSRWSWHPNPQAVILKLVALGADVNARDNQGKTPLMYVEGLYHVYQGGAAALIKTFVALGADVNARDNDGNTALLLACGKKHGRHLIQPLIEAGADIDVQNNSDQTAPDVELRFLLTTIETMRFFKTSLENAENKSHDLAL
jgi:ankyrin repeat protein